MFYIAHKILNLLTILTNQIAKFESDQHKISRLYKYRVSHI